MKNLCLFILLISTFSMGQDAPIQFVPDGGFPTPVATPESSAPVTEVPASPAPTVVPAPTSPVNASSQTGWDDAPAASSWEPPAQPASTESPTVQEPVAPPMTESSSTATVTEPLPFVPAESYSANPQPVQPQTVQPQPAQVQPGQQQPIQPQPVPAPAPMFVPDPEPKPAPRTEVVYPVVVAPAPAPAPVPVQQRAPVSDPWAEHERRLDSLDGLSNGLPSMLTNSVHGFFFNPRIAITLNPHTLFGNSEFYQGDVDANGLIVRSSADFMLVVGYEDEWRVAAGVGGLLFVNHNYRNLGYLDAGLMPAIQGEAGFPFVGFRQTLAWHLKGAEFISMVSRTGAYIKSGFLGFEGGYAIITNFGQGPYLSVFFDI